MRVIEFKSPKGELVYIVRDSVVAFTDGPQCSYVHLSSGEKLEVNLTVKAAAELWQKAFPAQFVTPATL